MCNVKLSLVLGTRTDLKRQVNVENNQVFVNPFDTVYDLWACTVFTAIKWQKHLL